MSENINHNVNNIVTDILKIINLSALIMYHQKIGNNDEVLGCKFCIIMHTDNKLEIEKEIYKRVNSDIPFDVIIYTVDEWNRLSIKEHSFAKHILEKGVVLYGKV
jgi:hypothetical protein